MEREPSPGSVVGKTPEEVRLDLPGADEFLLVCPSLTANGSVSAWNALACSNDFGEMA